MGDVVEVIESGGAIAEPSKPPTGKSATSAQVGVASALTVRQSGADKCGEMRSE